MTLIKKVFNDFGKTDTKLAFIVSTTLYYIKNRNLRDALSFSSQFVVIFLILLNLID